MQIPRTRLRKLHRFHFLLFSRTTSKKPSRFTQNFWSQSRRLFVARDEGRIFTFSIKNHQFPLFWHVYGIFAQKFHPEFIKFHPKMTFWPSSRTTKSLRDWLQKFWVNLEGFLLVVREKTKKWNRRNFLRRVRSFWLQKWLIFNFSVQNESYSAF